MRNRGKLRWWIGTTVCVLGVALGIALGFWQLGRAADKAAWHSAMQQQAQAAPLMAAEVQALLAQGVPVAQQQLHRPIALQGQWLAAHTVYLDNRQMQARPGFFVLTPLQLDTGDVVVVQRGWVPRNFQDRQALPEVPTPQGPVTVQGKVAGAPARLLSLGDSEVLDAQAPQIRQNLDLHNFAQATGLPLWPLTVVQTNPASDGLLREWPQVSSGIATHYGYAFQWFAMAAVLAAMLLWFQCIQPARQARLQRHVHLSP